MVFFLTKKPSPSTHFILNKKRKGSEIICQQIVLEILHQSKKWMTAREIETKIKSISIGSIMTNLKKLKKHNLIETKKGKTTTKTNVQIPVTKYRTKPQ